jgi:hypothetical protein
MSTVSEHIERATTTSPTPVPVHDPWWPRRRCAAVAGPRRRCAPTIGAGRGAVADTVLAFARRSA